ncbi:MAG: hypothetical protein WCT29_00130 [Candidatus Paceibacterota bacterium]|jgi:hypothetical protein
MITKELERYIIQAKAQGMTEAQIRQNLMGSGGWSPADLDQAFSVFSGGGISGGTVVAGGATVGAKSYLGWVIGAILILGAVGGGGYYFLNLSNNPGSSSSEFNASTGQLNSSEEDLAAEGLGQTPTNPVPGTLTESKPSNTFGVEKDCGIALNDDEFNDKGACMGLALATCSLAKIAQGPTTERLTITIKPEGNSCILSASSNVEVSGFELKTCKFSNSSLSTLRSELLNLKQRVNPSFKGGAMDESINTDIFLRIFEATLDEKALKSLQTGTISFSKMDVSCQ